MSKRDSGKPRDKRRAEHKARQQGSAGPRPARHVLSPDDERAFNRMARKACSDCGAPVEWVDAERAKAHGMDVTEAARFLGVEDVSGLEIWICTRCEGGGVMGPSEGFL